MNLFIDSLNQIEIHIYLVSPQLTLKQVDFIGKCQIPVFSLAVSQHMHKITNMWKFELDWSSELRDNYERKTTPLSHEDVCFQMLDF